MKLILSPIRSDEVLEASVAGDVLTLNGEDFDFGPLEEGSTVPQEAVSSDWIVGDATRVSGQVEVVLLFPIGGEASLAARFPNPMVVESGPVEFPV